MKKTAIIAFAALISCTVTAGAYTGASDWAKAELEKADSYSLIPASLSNADVSAPITRSEFASLSVKLFEAFGKEEIKAPAANPFTDTQDKEILKAYAAGITTGTSETTFEPDALLSREQAATMLARTYSKSMNADVKPSGTAEKFKDDADISDWAKESVYFMVENGIINGIGDGLFAPQNVTKEQEDKLYANSTREQAVAISVRMYEKFKKDEVNPETQPETKPEDKKEDLADIKKKIPAFAFGNVTSEDIKDNSAAITLSDVAQDDFEKYRDTVKMFFPNFTYELDEPYQKAIKCNDGQYSVFISWTPDGKMSLSVEKQ